jgi:Lrp/AsnC family transcriptional regulator, leucine-responsive regulatory protein
MKPLQARLPGSLDQTDHRILEALAADPRASMAVVGRLVGMSAPAVTERVQRLEAAGVMSFRLEVDPAALGLPVAAFARVRPAAGQLSAIAALAATLPQVTECHRITGEDCFLIKVHAGTVAGLEEILDKFLVYGQTITSIVVATPVPIRPVAAAPPGS